jgi:hypothetical protein
MQRRILMLPVAAVIAMELGLAIGTRTATAHFAVARDRNAGCARTPVSYSRTGRSSRSTKRYPTLRTVSMN